MCQLRLYVGRAATDIPVSTQGLWHILGFVESTTYLNEESLLEKQTVVSSNHSRDIASTWNGRVPVRPHGALAFAVPKVCQNSALACASALASAAGANDQIVHETFREWDNALTPGFPERTETSVTHGRKIPELTRKSQLIQGLHKNCLAARHPSSPRDRSPEWRCWSTPLETATSSD